MNRWRRENDDHFHLSRSPDLLIPFLFTAQIDFSSCFYLMDMGFVPLTLQYNSSVTVKSSSVLVISNHSQHIRQTWSDCWLICLALISFTRELMVNLFGIWCLWKLLVVTKGSFCCLLKLFLVNKWTHCEVASLSQCLLYAWSLIKYHPALVFKYSLACYICCTNIFTESNVGAWLNLMLSQCFCINLLWTTS